MTIEKVINGEEAVLKLEGWLDTQTAPELGEAINALPEAVTALTIDFSELEYISSAGLRQIVAAYKRMKGNLRLRNVPAGIMDVIKMAGLDKRLKIE